MSFGGIQSYLGLQSMGMSPSAVRSPLPLPTHPNHVLAVPPGNTLVAQLPFAIGLSRFRQSVVSEHPVSLVIDSSSATIEGGAIAFGLLQRSFPQSADISIVFPKDCSRSFLQWSYERTKVDVANNQGLFALLLKTHRAIVADPFSECSEETKEQLRDVNYRAQKLMTHFMNVLKQWEWGYQHQVHYGPMRISSALDKSIHDAKRRVNIWMFVQKAAQTLLEGGLLLPTHAEIFERALAGHNNRVGNAFQEGIDLAKDELDRFGHEVVVEEDAEGIRDQMFFKTDEIAKNLALMDIMANLVTNAARYYGEGIERENIAKLGREKFREGRKVLAESNGHGLENVIKSLNQHGWGALWVKSSPPDETDPSKPKIRVSSNVLRDGSLEITVADKATQFLFVIPVHEIAWTDSKSFPAESTIMRYASYMDAGFLIPHASLSAFLPELDRSPFSEMLWDAITQGRPLHSQRVRTALPRIKSTSEGK
ncbi:MAG: sensor histidine kinase [Deltaproteobacteria bacterium]|nr:sensor histidine kinase [Deltaproteobacteria bacterium]